MSKSRTALQKEVVAALVSSKAINLDAVGAVFSKFGTKAALEGDSIAVIIGRRAWDICIPVDPYDLRGNLAEQVRGQAGR
jgi:hypothetical protein